MSVPRRQVDQWPAWRFGPDGEKAQFDKPEDVPPGWTPKPQLQYVAPEPRPDINAEDTAEKLASAGIKVDPRWSKGKLWEELMKAYP